jgi:hypothetical protein
MIVGLGVAALVASLAAYHVFVLHHSAEHYHLLLESSTVAEKRLHYDAIHRFFHPWNPYREASERWLKEEGHEWGNLGLKREGAGGL